MDAYAFEARTLKALAHPVRLRIVDILRGGEQCVCDLETALGLRQACVSQHLMTLRRAGVVTDRKDGLRVYTDRKSNECMGRRVLNLLRPKPEQVRESGVH